MFVVLRGFKSASYDVNLFRSCLRGEPIDTPFHRAVQRSTNTTEARRHAACAELADAVLSAGGDSLWYSRGILARPKLSPGRGPILGAASPREFPLFAPNEALSAWTVHRRIPLTARWLVRIGRQCNAYMNDTGQMCNVRVLSRSLS